MLGTAGSIWPASCFRSRLTPNQAGPKTGGRPASVVGLVGLGAGQAAVLPSVGSSAASATVKNNHDATVAIAAFAVFLFLGAFPVAGSQLALASLAFVPLVSLLLLVALRDLVVRICTLGGRSGDCFCFLSPLAPLAIAIMVMWPNIDIVKHWMSAPPTTLHGFQNIRLSAPQTEELRKVVSWIEGNCDMVFSDPGVLTLNLLSKVPFPGRAPSNAWYRILNETEERRIISSLESADQPCLVSDPANRSFWLRDQEPRASRLDKYLKDNFRIVETVGRYDVSTNGTIAQS